MSTVRKGHSLYQLYNTRQEDREDRGHEGDTMKIKENQTWGDHELARYWH